MLYLPYPVYCIPTSSKLLMCRNCLHFKFFSLFSRSWSL